MNLPDSSPSWKPDIKATVDPDTKPRCSSPEHTPHSSLRDDVQAIEAAIDVDWYGPNPKYHPTIEAGRAALRRLEEQLEALRDLLVRCQECVRREAKYRRPLQPRGLVYQHR